MATIVEVKGQLDTHEAVCAERYLGINARLKRLEQILIGSAGCIILLLLNLIYRFWSPVENWTPIPTLPFLSLEVTVSGFTRGLSFLRVLRTTFGRLELGQITQ